MTTQPLDPQWSALADLVAARVAEQIASATLKPVSPWLLPKDAAAYLGLRTISLEKMRARGEGPKWSKLGHRIVRYHVRELDRWIERGAAARSDAAEA